MSQQVVVRMVSKFIVEVLFIFICLLFVIVATSSQTPLTNNLNPAQETRCLSCIRNVTTLLGIDTSKRCEGYYCGQYQISYTYWAEAGKPGPQQSSRDYEKCARDKSCAEQTVKAYFRKFKRDCNNDGVIDCLDMAALHKGGPTACTADWFYKSRFWVAFNKTICALDKDATSLKADHYEDATQVAPSRVMKNQSLTTECLDCICDAVSGCSTSVNNCGSGTVCGPFAISQAYWKEGRKPGLSWTSCARTKECSSVTVKNYMEKYKKDCNGDGLITCEDYAAIHRGGPRACANRDPQRDYYWNKFLSCRANQKPTNDVNMVKVGEMSDDISSRRESTTSASTSTSLAVSSTIKTQDQPTKASTPSRYEYLQASTYELSSIGSKPARDEHIVARPSPFVSSPQHTLPDFRPLASLGPPIVDRPTIPQTSWPPSSPSTTPALPTVVTQPTPSLIFHTEVPPSTSMADNQRPDTFSASAGELLVVPPGQVGDEIDYSIPDYAATVSSYGGNNNDRTSSFDKVVLGIVGNPDFSKSYPPVPDIVTLHGKQSEPIPIESTESTLSSSVKVQQKITTNHSRSNGRPSPPHPPGQSSPTSVPSNKPPPAPPIRIQSEFQQRISAPINPAATYENQSDKKFDHALPVSITGPDALNMSSLFEGGLNETSRISNECLECICDASSNCDTTVQCISKQRDKNRCGLYMISWNQFQDSEISLTSLASLSSSSNEESLDEKLYYDCATDRVCAEKLIHLYIEKYQKDCNNDGKIDCYDIAAIHRVGPNQCNSAKFLSSQYWKDFNNCYTNERLTTTTTILP